MTFISLNYRIFSYQKVG
jgi:hypothetical protein